MKYFVWNIEKNEILKRERGISFEEILDRIEHDGLLDIVEHPNKRKYPDQKMFIIEIDRYVYIVPFVETEDEVFLKTVIPSRKATKQYLGGGNADEKENE